MLVDISELDWLLGLLTRGNDSQILYIKKFIAWTIQHPDIKQQVCLILIGGQGIGKSLLGRVLMAHLLGNLAGTADAVALRDNRFVISPFIGKLMVFIDEMRLENIGSINTIKKLVRENVISGEQKFHDQQDHNILARLIVAANSPDLGFTSDDAGDRAAYFAMGESPNSKGMLPQEFNRWTGTLKPQFNAMVGRWARHEFRQHLMRYFLELAVTREELEDLSTSSFEDEEVVRSRMSKTCEVARMIVADARIHADYDITAWFATSDVRTAIVRVAGKRTKVEASDVVREYDRAGVTETVQGDTRKFKWGYGKLLKVFGDATGMPITPNHRFRPGDFDDNPVRSSYEMPGWRGKDKRRPNYQTYDPDDMPNF
jgi:hypothetical protein